MNSLRHRDKLVRYLFVGGSAAVVDFVVFVVVLHLLTMVNFATSGTSPFYPEQLANAASLLCGFLFSFFLHRFWSFRSTGNPYPQLAKTILLVIINTAVSSALISVLARDFGLNIKIAKLILQGLVASWNYLIFNYLIYNSRKRCSP
jgi:putative flippase GtrA